MTWLSGRQLARVERWIDEAVMSLLLDHTIATLPGVRTWSPDWREWHRDVAGRALDHCVRGAVGPHTRSNRAGTLRRLRRRSRHRRLGRGMPSGMRFSVQLSPQRGRLMGALIAIIVATGLAVIVICEAAK